MIEKNILFIGGGNMAEGIIRGLINNQTVSPDHIHVNEIIETRLDYLKETYAIQAVSKLEETIKVSDMVFLAVRPQDVEGTLSSMKHLVNDKQLLISICAGIDIERLKAWSGLNKVARVMPNVLIEAKHGFSGVCVSPSVTKEDKEIIETLFSAIGQTLFIHEDQFNEFTAFSCAGPAYVMYFMAGMIDAGVKSGFSRADSTKMVIENLIGSGMMIDITKKNTYQLTDTMTSPAGVTIEGIHVLERAGFKGIVMDAVKAAVDKSNEF